MSSKLIGHCAFVNLFSPWKFLFVHLSQCYTCVTSGLLLGFQQFADFWRLMCFADAYARAALSLFKPRKRTLHDLGPERKIAALFGTRRISATPVFVE